MSGAAVSSQRAESLAGRHALVVGIGVTGVAATRALVGAGVSVRAVDAGDGPEVRERAQALARDGVEVRTGAAGLDVLEGIDLVVPSPGVPEGGPVIAAALRGGLAVWSEPELAWRLNGGRTRLVAVTGTNGKTTVTELLAACLEAPSAGNIGTPLVDLLAAPAPPPLVVAELSSFQLRFVETLAPDVSVLLNVAPDHLDWHGTLEAYAAAKAQVWAHQPKDAYAVINADDEGAHALAARHPPPCQRVGFTVTAPDHGQVGVEGGAIVARLSRPGRRVVGVDELAMPGRIGVINSLAATAAALCAGAPVARVVQALQEVPAGPHRLERVAELRGVAFVNDSKATNPHAAAAALSSFPRVVWIAGGLGKGLDFDELVDVLAARARAVVTIGEAGPRIARLARGLGVRVVQAGTIDEAVPVAAELAEPGDTVLLAPACASMDQFRNYAARGEAFRAAVAALEAEGAVT